MILIDTNIICEVMKINPSLHVLKWLNEQESNVLYVSSITIGEIEYGLSILPDDRRRLKLKERFELFISEGFKHRILAFDESAARTFGDIMGFRKEIGRPMSITDGQIAAIARVGGLSIATRNTTDFEECNLDLINPFSV